jgi:hypothetical protein
MINLDYYESGANLSPATKKAKRTSIIVQEKRKIYLDNKVDLTITDPDIHK